MTEPVKSNYGQVFEKGTILNWFSTQGKICPLTGAPLCEVDLTPLPELAEKIRTWLLDKSKGKIVPEEEAGSSRRGEDKRQDDLYDF